MSSSFEKVGAESVAFMDYLTKWPLLPTRIPDHPQTDGLVEQFNRMLTTEMLAKKNVSTDKRDWDLKLPFVLFSYHTNPQESTQETPFRLLYGRDAVLPTEEVLQPWINRSFIQLDSYAGEMAENLEGAWKLARPKKSYAKTPDYQVGDEVLLYMPARKQGPLRKFASPYEGPYVITNIPNTGVELRLQSKPLFVWPGTESGGAHGRLGNRRHL